MNRRVLPSLMSLVVLLCAGRASVAQYPDALGELDAIVILARYTEPAPFSRAQAESDFVAVAEWFEENS